MRRPDLDEGDLEAWHCEGPPAAMTLLYKRYAPRCINLRKIRRYDSYLDLFHREDGISHPAWRGEAWPS